MSQLITIPNYERENKKELSNLAVWVLAGDTSFTLFNNNNIVADDFMLIGRPGNETANSVTIKAGTSGTIDGSNTVVLSSQYKYLTVVSTTTSDLWYVVAGQLVAVSLPVGTLGV